MDRLPADTPWKRVFGIGLLMGFVTNAGGFPWVLSLLVRFGHLPLVGALPLFALLIAYQGLMYALFALVYRALRRRGLPATLAAPLALVPLELVYPMVFPWYLAINQAWVPRGIQIAELTGPTGVSALLALCAGVVTDVVAWRAGAALPRRTIAVAIAVLVANPILGSLRMRQIEARRAAAPQVRIGVVQGNVPQLEKFDPRFARKQLDAHQAASRELARQGAELIVWPESSYPGMVERDQWRDWPVGDGLRIRDGWEVPSLVGSPTGVMDEKNPLAWNSALMIARDDRFTGRFDKNYLMIFGEYIPFYRWLPQFREWFPEASNWERGDGIAVFPFERKDPRTGQTQTFRLAPIICYEDIIPAFVRKYASERIHLIVNITNDAWFGKTGEPYEHLQLAVYRSIELRRDMVRAVNTGTTTFVSATGEVWRMGPVFDPVAEQVTPITFLERVAMLEGDTVYGRVGDVFGIGCSIILLGVLVVRRRPRAPAARS